MGGETLRQFALGWIASLICISLFGCSKDGTQEDVKVRDHLDQSAAPAFSATLTYSPDKRVSYTGSSCNLETLDQLPFGSDNVMVAKTSPLVLTGWAYDEITKQPATSLHVVLLDSTKKARYFGRVAKATSRPDVGQYLHLPDLINVGFETTLSLSPVEEGTYRVVLGIDRAEDVAICDVGRSITVSGH